jgi:hypothetical protein
MTSPNSVTLDPVKCGIRAGEICILLATRGRPHFLVEELATLQTNTARKDKVVMWVYVDDDDKITRDAIAKNEFPDPGFPVHWHIGPRPAGLGQTHQTLWCESGRVSEIYMITCDDARFDTAGWDEIVRQKFNAHQDGVVLAFAHDPNASGQATYPFIGWGFLQTLGYEKVFPGIFAFWFDDKWVEHIGFMVGRCIKIPIVINPVGGDKGKTQRMRCVPFWTRFFQLTLIERKACAEQLINAMFPADETGCKAALTEMEKAHTFLLNDENNTFSEDYATFQEERHSALKPEDRDLFNPLYIRQEVAAIVRLLSHAKKNITGKKFAEALQFIEATQLADLRLRQALDMKVECLRALGRHDEAAQIAREKFLAWPESTYVRRIFRFLGMIATEVRRITAARNQKKNPAKPGL